jgi:hypothetical protein
MPNRRPSKRPFSNRGTNGAIPGCAFLLQRSIFAAAAFLTALLGSGKVEASSSFDLGYGGRLADGEGRPIDGPIEIVLEFFQTQDGGQPIGGRYRFPNTPLVDGVFALTIRLNSTDSTAIFGSTGEVWVQITDATNQRTFPRQYFSAVPYALRVPVDDATIHFDATGRLAIKNIASLTHDAISATPPLRYTDGVVLLDQAMANQDGYLARGDWSTFNSKQPSGPYLTGLQGDVVAVGPGNGVATLSNTGITAGTYSKIEFDAKGRAIRGLPLTPSDIPPIDATLVSSGQLSVTQGGTGANLGSTGGSGHFLKQEAVGGTVSVGPIVRSDMPTMIGDLGSGGEKGSVPAPASGDAAAGRYLKADGTWSVPLPSWESPGSIGTANPNNARFTMLTTSGNVGIGTVSPDAALDVSGSVTVSANIDIKNLSSGSSSGTLGFTKRGAAGDSMSPVEVGASLGTISFSGWDGTSYGLGATISSKTVDSFNGSSHGSTLEFSTTESGTNTGALRMMIAPNGNIGVGTDQPGALLDVNGAIRASSFIASGGASNFAAQGINNVGSLSIGTTSPGSDLFFGAGVDRTISVQQASSHGQQLTIQAGAAGTSSGTPLDGGDLILASGVASGGTSKIQLKTANGGAPVASLTILGNGNVGIGTEAPVGSFDVNGLFTVASGGGVGIGTTVPANTLSVNGSADFSGHVGIGTSSTALPLTLQRSDTSTNSVLDVLKINRVTTGTAANGIGAGIVFSRGSSDLARIAVVDDWTGGPQSSLTFGTTYGSNITEGMRLYNGGGRNALLLGTSVPNDYKLQVYGDVNTNLLSGVLSIDGQQFGAVSSNGTNAPVLINASGIKGGDTTGTTGQTAGTGSAILITAGQGGDAPAGSTNGAGGSVTINPGAPGSGAGVAGATGSILLATSGGNVGIGTTIAAAKLQISGGQAAGAFITNSVAEIDWNNGNMQTTSVAPGTITLSNMLDGASYSLILTGGIAGNFTLNGTNLTFRCNPACPVQTVTGKDTIVTMIKGGSTVWVAWTPGFQ